MCLRCVTVLIIQTPNDLKYSNYTVNPSKYPEENKEIRFHHHYQVYLIHYFDQDQMTSLTYVIQCRIQVRSGYFINWIIPS